MLKRDELTNPASCMSRARDDEMTFVLLARDVAAPAAIRAWVNERIRLGKNQPGDDQIAAVAFRQNPRLKLLRLDAAEQLDSSSKALLLKLADESGWQCIMACVGENEGLRVEICE